MSRNIILIYNIWLYLQVLAQTIYSKDNKVRVCGVCVCALQDYFHRHIYHNSQYVIGKYILKIKIYYYFIKPINYIVQFLFKTLERNQKNIIKIIIIISVIIDHGHTTNIVYIICPFNLFKCMQYQNIYIKKYKIITILYSYTSDNFMYNIYCLLFKYLSSYI